MSYETLKLSIDQKIAHVSLNRPDALNAFNMQLFHDLKTVFSDMNHRSDVRVIVLSGEGKHFTAGLDLKEAAGELFDNSPGDAGRKREQFRRKVKHLQNCISAVDQCRVPVIVAVHGACIGAGMDLIAGCDIRILANDAYCTVQEINVGLVADIGSLQRLPDLLPGGILRELAYTARKLKADEALRLGFANHVADDRAAAIEHALEIAATIAAKTPLAITGLKDVMNYQRDHSVQEGLDYVGLWNTGMLQGEDTLKAVQATLTKQAASFDDLMED